MRFPDFSRHTFAFNFYFYSENAIGYRKENKDEDNLILYEKLWREQLSIWIRRREKTYIRYKDVKYECRKWILGKREETI